MADEYVRIRGRIEAVRKGSILLSVGESVRRAGWIPRSLIHGADEITLDGRMIGDQVALRVFEWKADELGFTSDHDRDGADGDLFGDR
jgi:hypothetical protein